METPEERLTKAREIYDHHIMVEMLAHSHVLITPCANSTSHPFLELHKGITAARPEEPHEEPSSARPLSGAIVLLALFQSLVLPD